MQSRHDRARQKFPVYSFIAVSLLLLAALLIWKGRVYEEAAGARQFMDMPGPLRALYWWIVAGCSTGLVVIGSAIAWLRKRHRHGETILKTLH
jgi:hypothetical protein